jgi:hypothetical protein
MKLYNENGQLSDHGKMIFDECLKSGIGKLLHSPDSAEEIRLLGSLIHHYVGNVVLDKAIKFKK